MRRLLAIALLVLIVSYVSAPLLALSTDSEAGVPTCCKTGGKHHCMMRAVEASGSEHQLATVGERCPNFPKAVTAAVNHIFSASGAAGIYSQVVAHPTGAAQVQAQRRISYDRSRQKRGPPEFLL